MTTLTSTPPLDPTLSRLGDDPVRTPTPPVVVLSAGLDRVADTANKLAVGRHRYTTDPPTDHADIAVVRPDALDRLDATRRSFPGATVVVYDTSTTTPGELVADAIAAGVDAYITRATPAVLVAQVDALLRARSPGTLPTVDDPVQASSRRGRHCLDVDPRGRFAAPITVAAADQDVGTDDVSTPASQSSPRWWSIPITWAVAGVAAAALIAATAPTSDRPPERIGVALILAGAVGALFALRDRQWRIVPFGAALITGGVLLLVDGPRFIEPVTRAGGLVVLLAGVVASRSVVTRVGRLAGATTFAIFAAAATLFVYYDRELLSLSLGACGALVAVVAGTGLVQADNAGELTAATELRTVAVRGARAIAARASNAEVGEPVRDKVLYTGADRGRRLFRFVMLMAFASAIAALGVIADSTAVVIGAMLVAPLLTPFMGMSLSLATGSTEELGRASFVAALGTLVAIAIGYLTSAVLGRATDIDANAEIVSRVSPTLIDLAIALAAGAAGAYALSRRDVSDALPGVAVAIALVPPLAVVGITAQLGASDEAIGALLLFVTNALAVVAMGALTFIVTGTAAADAPRRWTLDWWTIGLGAITVAVFAALVMNTASVNGADAASDRATAVVERWIGDRDYELLSMEVDGADASIVLSGPSSPDDLDTLGDDLHALLPDIDSVDIRIAVTEHTTLEVEE